MTYAEKLRDPRWQRKRLEVMSRAGFRCEHCGDGRSTLNVHHTIYRKGADPWEYEDGELECLCERCHGEEHASREQLQQALAAEGPWALDVVLGVAEALQMISGHRTMIRVPNESRAAGVSLVYRISPSDVQGLRDAVGLVTAEQLKKAQQEQGR